VIVGAGHNGLVAAIVLARAGLDVLVLERDEVIGGACRTERPFAAAPELGASTGAYLLGPLPPELLQALDLDLPLLRRDPHYFLPTAEPGRSLLLGADAAANRQALAAFSSEEDVRALDAMQAELTAMRDDLAPAWLAPPLPVEETAERYVRPELREVFVDLVRGSVAGHLGRFDFASDLLPAMYAVTDAFPGLHGGWDTPGSGFNFLVHNLCRLPGADGTWMIVRGGMGTVTAALADRARAAGARIVTGAEVAAITTSGGRLDGVAVGDEVVEAEVVLVNADPVRLVELAGAAAAGPDASRVADLVRERPGTTLKLNLALRELPRFTSLPDPVGQHRGTIHLLPDLDDPLPALRAALDAALAGEVPERPPIEIYLHTAVDPSLSDAAGHHSGALFVQWVPNRPAGGTWDELADPTADRLLALVDEVAPGTSELVVDRQVLHPAAIEERFGITGGHIFHLDNSLSFTDRLPYRTATDGVYACGAGCHPAGSVIGAAGWNAAHQALADRGVAVPALTPRPGA
jgi:phytoene dehydrogenase-like protein